MFQHVDYIQNKLVYRVNFLLPTTTTSRPAEYKRDNFLVSVALWTRISRDLDAESFASRVS